MKKQQREKNMSNVTKICSSIFEYQRRAGFAMYHVRIDTLKITSDRTVVRSPVCWSRLVCASLATITVSRYSPMLPNRSRLPHQNVANAFRYGVH